MSSLEGVEPRTRARVITDVYSRYTVKGTMAGSTKQHDGMERAGGWGGAAAAGVRGVGERGVSVFMILHAIVIDTFTGQHDHYGSWGGW